MTNPEARKREAARNAAPDTTGHREADPTPEPDATVSDPAPLTDAERQRVTENPQEFLMRTLSKGQWRVVADCLRIEVAEAVEQERAKWVAATGETTPDNARVAWDDFAASVDRERDARLALIAKIKALVEDGMTDAGDCCSDYCVADVHDLRLDQAERLEEILRALLIADDTKATS